MKRGIGRHISWARKRLGLTQAQLSELIKVHPVTLSNWERGEREPVASDIEKLCESLRISKTEFFNGPQPNTWEVRVIFEADDEWRDTTMDMRSEAANTFSVHISPTKIGIEIIGNVEDETQLDSLLAEARAKALDAMAMRGKYRN